MGSGALGINTNIVFITLWESRQKKKKSMFGQVGAHNLSPFNPLPDNMFPNSKTVNEKKALRIQCGNPAQCIWEEARRTMAIPWEGNVSQGLSAFYPTIQQTQQEDDIQWQLMAISNALITLVFGS